MFCWRYGNGGSLQLAACVCRLQALVQQSLQCEPAVAETHFLRSCLTIGPSEPADCRTANSLLQILFPRAVCEQSCEWTRASDDRKNSSYMCRVRACVCVRERAEDIEEQWGHKCAKTVHPSYICISLLGTAAAASFQCGAKKAKYRLNYDYN